TLVSLVLGVGAVVLGSLVAMNRDDRLHRSLCGMVGISGIGAMHFVGVGALDLPGRLVTWDPVLAGAGVAGGLAIAMATGALAHGRNAGGFTALCLGGALSIVTLHFTGMSAMTVAPGAAAATAAIGPTLSASSM